MNLRIFFIMLAMTPSILAYTVDPHRYTTTTKKIISDYIYDKTFKITLEDLHCILRLAYLSYLRSETTLSAQEAALKNLESAWKIWSNIAQRRLDPSKPQPHDIDQSTKTDCELWEHHNNHYDVGIAYADAVETIVHGNALTTINAQNAVKTVRSQARALVAQELVSIQNMLGSLFYTAQKKGLPSFSSLIHCLTDTIPSLAMHSFVEANNLNDQLSEETWDVLFAIQSFGADTWQAIEEVRASLYLSLYNELTAIVDECLAE